MDWFPRDVPAYRQDTRHLTTLEHGAYCLLIDEYYVTRLPLPDNDRVLARISGLSLPEWNEIAQTIRAFFAIKNNLLHLKRADAELDKQDRLSKKRSERAQKAAIIRHHGIKGLNAMGMLDACSEDARAMLGDATETETYTKTREERVRAAPVGAVLNNSKGVSKNGRAIKINILDWEPDEQDREYARAAGRDPDKIYAAIRNWAPNAGSGAFKAKPRAFWNGWCDRAADRGESGLGGPRASGKGPSSLFAAAAKVLSQGEDQHGIRPDGNGSDQDSKQGTSESGSGMAGSNRHPDTAIDLGSGNYTVLNPDKIQSAG